MKALLLAMLIAMPAMAASNYDKPDKLVALPDGRKLNIYCSGSGGSKPTVIMEAGYQSWSFGWRATQELLEQRYRVCSYDRAGLGFSDFGPLPRDGAHIAADLDALITAAALKPPFVLVGHSAGGMSMRLLADRRLADVAGLVLVDPSIERQFAGIEGSVTYVANDYRKCAEAAKANRLPSSEFPKCVSLAASFMAPRMAAEVTIRALGPDYWLTQASEYESIAIATSNQLLAGRQNYGDLPLVVLTAGNNLNPRWAAAHAALAARSTRGVQHIVERSGHLIHIERPDAIADAVDEVVKAHRSKATGAAGVEPKRRAR